MECIHLVEDLIRSMVVSLYALSADTQTRRRHEHRHALYKYDCHYLNRSEDLDKHVEGESESGDGSVGQMSAASQQVYCNGQCFVYVPPMEEWSNKSERSLRHCEYHR